jgi:hypothetical protein
MESCQPIKRLKDKKKKMRIETGVMLNDSGSSQVGLAHPSGIRTLETGKGL